MANSILNKVGGQIRFFTEFSWGPSDNGTNWTIGTPTDVVLNMGALLDGEGSQSTKFDFGALRAQEYELLGCVDFTGEIPVAGGTIDYYFAPSTSTTQSNGNVAGNSGGAADAPNGALGGITLAEFLLQCVFIGSLIIHDGAVPQNGKVGRFSPSSRFGQLIVVNNSGGTTENITDEHHQVFNPVVSEVQ